MVNRGRRNLFVVIAVILVALAVIVGACVLIFGDYLIPAIQATTPYSYAFLLVVAIALLIYFA